MAGSWQLRSALLNGTSDSDAELEALLADGWEPFAAGPGGNYGTQVLLRRQGDTDAEK